MEKRRTLMRLMHSRARLTARLGTSLGAIGLLTAGYSTVVHVNPTTVALTYVVVILLIATGWGIAEATAASIAAVLCFNFFFLPPVGTFTIADPENWVALVAFLLTAIVASQMSGRARQRHIEVLARQRDLERLYALSRALLLSDSGASVPGTIARHIAETFELRAVALHDQRTDRVWWAGPVETPAGEGMLRVAIELGGVPIGSLSILDGGLSDTVLRSIANLAAIGLERARGEEAATRAEAARQSSELRATILDALAHDFKTPLTSMKAAAGDLVTGAALGARERELTMIIHEDLERFQALVSDAVQMLRIDAGDFAVHADRHRVDEIVQATLRPLAQRLDGHRLVTRIPDGLTVDGDRELLTLALRQLLDNALKYSPPNSSIEVSADGGAGVRLVVHNSGSAIPAAEQPRVVERFFRGAGARKIPGTGMGLAIVQQIARAHGGALTIDSSEETGTAFTLSIPREAHA